ncbi:Ig-like domain-containing protein [Blautia wexlerae]|uniref:Ig-like domain-containing protein n=1 Tax=Blautia wexlerae TaxID=418240 RepID=UPI0034A3318E
MKKKCFKKTVSWALSIVMSATMAVTPVLADTFTDDSQSIISGNAEIPAVDVESDTNCGDTMGDSDCIEKELTEFQDPLFMEEDYGDAESARFSSGNDAEVVSDFYDDSVPAAQTEEKAVVYLDPTRGNNNNTGESDTAAVQTLSKALGLVAQNGVIYLLNPVTVDSQMTLSNVTFRPGKSNMLGMLYISGDVTLNNIKIYNETPDGRSCQFSNDPIRVTGTLTIGKGTRIESFLGKSCIYVSQGTLNLNGGKIQGDTQNTVKHGGGIYAKNATVNVYEGIISRHSATYGGGIYADNSSININGGQIIDSQATKGGGIYANGGNVYINGGRISGHRATYGGGIYLDQASIYIKEGGINDNQATKGGAIYTEGTKAGSCLLNIEGGTISGNCANESGAGIFAICSKGTRDDMKVEIFGGTIAHNYSGTGENLEENAIVLMGEDPNLTEDTGFADLYLSGSPVITGSVTLADDYCAADSKNYSPLIHVDDSFNVNKPILVSPIYGDDPDTSVVIYDSESIAKNYQSHFCSKEGSNRELVKKGATLKWVVKVNVRLRTFADITAFPVLNPEKSIYLIKGEKVSPNDVPKAAVIPGYVRTGWLNVSDNTTWDPASEITDNMIVREVWALVKPDVQVSADKEKGCPSSKIVLTAKTTHVLDDKGINYSYQWYKDGQTLGQTGETLTVSKAGTYKVEVTATSQAGATSKETASIVIPAFEHSYSWQSDKTNHWKHCSIGNEDTAQEAHQFDGWTVIKQASIGVEGEKERTCKVCGYKEKETIPSIYKVNVRLRTFADITNFPVLNPEKSIYLIKGEKVSPNDVPEAAVIRGYVRTGWFNESGNTTWDPASEITDNMIIREVWALVKPIVQVSADKEKGCPSSKIVLTAKATHVLDDKGITYSYQWYKDNQTLDGQTGGTLTVSEAGTYKVEVTATSQAGATSKETASIVIPAFEHSYSWQSDKTNHWKHCSIGNEDTAQEAHQFDGWTVIKQASIGVEGEKERNCKVCGYKETATIPAIYIPSYPVTGIKVSPDTLTLNRKDETAQLTAEVIPSYADNTRVKWKSSDENVVTVDEKGKVTAVGNGTATITVTSVSGNYTATVAVTVKIPVEIEKISIEAEKETLTKLGESTELKVKIEPENADAQKLIWKSENEMIAAVDENGKVTAIGNGMAIITVTTEDGKNTASITITVKIPDEPVINKTKGFGRLKVRSVNQTKTSITLEWSKLDGVDGYLVYGNRCNTNTKTYKYQKLATITNGRTWTHKNLKKGTFYKYIVKAYKIVDGKKVVTDTSVSIHVITQGSKYGIAKSVSVTKIGNKKNVSKITLKKGKTAQITAKEIKKDKKIRHHRKLCYESCNTAVATVTPEGLIQAVGKGTCTIWVYAQNGVYVALTVTVK